MRWCLRAATVGAFTLVCMTGNWLLPAVAAVVMLAAYAFTGARA